MNFMHSQLLVKKNESTATDLPNGRTLFITRVDNRINETILKQSFKQFGPITKIQMKTVTKASDKNSFKEENLTESTSFAHIVFEKSESLNAVLNFCGKNLVAAKGDVPFKRASLFDMIPSQFYYSDPNLLKKSLDYFMMEYDVKKEKERMEEDQIPDVDEDGFMRVKRGLNLNKGLPHRVELGGSLAVRESDEMIARRKKTEKKERKNKHLDFYRFQLKDRKQQEILQARQQQMQDEKTVDEMRKRRKFIEKDN